MFLIKFFSENDARERPLFFFLSGGITFLLLVRFSFPKLENFQGKEEILIL